MRTRALGSVVVLAVLFVTAACGGDEQAADRETTASSGVQPDSSNTESAAANTDDMAEGGTPAPDDAGHRLAPTTTDVAPWSTWRETTNGLSRYVAGEWVELLAKPYEHATVVPNLGVVVQRDESPQVLWLETDDGPVELLKTAEPVTLALEGSFLDDDGVGHVIYQRHAPGSPTTQRSTMRRYNSETGEVTELFESGGWEWGTHLFSPATGQQALGSSSDGLPFVVDLISGEFLVDLSEDPRCITQPDHCPFAGEEHLAFGVVSGDDIIIADVGGVTRVSMETFERETIAAFPWDNGLWYPHGIMLDAREGSGDAVIVNIGSFDGLPYPALRVDLTSGETTTWPQAGFFLPNLGGLPDSVTAVPGDAPHHVGVDSSEGYRAAATITSECAQGLYWDGASVHHISHPGYFSYPASGIAELAGLLDLPGGTATQASGEKSPILLDGEPIIVPGVGEWVELEGADERYIYYQRHSGASPETQRSVLVRRLAFPELGEDTDEIEIMNTGEWESSTNFGMITSTLIVGQDNETLFVVDPESSDILHRLPVELDSNTGRYDTFTWRPTIEGGEILAVRPATTRGSSGTDRRGLFRVDPSTGEETLVATFAWDNGLWYPRDLLLLDDIAILNVATFEGDPLPALRIDLNTGQASTCDTAALHRVGYLS